MNKTKKVISLTFIDLKKPNAVFSRGKSGEKEILSEANRALTILAAPEYHHSGLEKRAGMENAK